MALDAYDPCNRWFVKQPEYYGLVVTERLFGEIITNLATSAAGGMPMDTPGRTRLPEREGSLTGATGPAAWLDTPAAPTPKPRRGVV